MSRDWTPYELHRADLEFGFSKDTLEMYIPQEDGSKTFVGFFYNPEDPITKQYPNLAFLWGQNELTRFISGLADNAGEACEAVLSDIEQILAEVVAHYDKPKTERKNGLSSSSDWTTIVNDWYLGRLDPNFYYNTENNERFELYILDQIHQLDCITKSGRDL